MTIFPSFIDLNAAKVGRPWITFPAYFGLEEKPSAPHPNDHVMDYNACILKIHFYLLINVGITFLQKVDYNFNITQQQ